MKVNWDEKHNAYVHPSDGQDNNCVSLVVEVVVVLDHSYILLEAVEVAVHYALVHLNNKEVDRRSSQVQKSL